MAFWRASQAWSRQKYGVPTSISPTSLGSSDPEVHSEVKGGLKQKKRKNLKNAENRQCGVKHHEQTKRWGWNEWDERCKNEKSKPRRLTAFIRAKRKWRGEDYAAPTSFHPPSFGDVDRAVYSEAKENLQTDKNQGKEQRSKGGVTLATRQRKAKEWGFRPTFLDRCMNRTTNCEGSASVQIPITAFLLFLLGGPPPTKSVSVFGLLEDIIKLLILKLANSIWTPTSLVCSPAGCAPGTSRGSPVLWYSRATLRRSIRAEKEHALSSRGRASYWNPARKIWHGTFKRPGGRDLPYNERHEESWRDKGRKDNSGAEEKPTQRERQWRQLSMNRFTNWKTNCNGPQMDWLWCWIFKQRGGKRKKGTMQRGETSSNWMTRQKPKKAPKRRTIGECKMI